MRPNSRSSMRTAFPWRILPAIPSPLQPRARAGFLGRSWVWVRPTFTAGISGWRPMPPDSPSRITIRSGMRMLPPISGMATLNSVWAPRGSTSRPPRRRSSSCGGRSIQASPGSGGIRTRFLLAAQQLYFLAGQLSPLADLQIADADRPDGGTNQFQYLAPDRLDHPADLTVASFGDRHFED